MTPLQLETGAVKTYGRKGWKPALARDLGCNVCTVFRMMHKEEIPQTTAVAAQAIFDTRRRQAALEREARKLLPRSLKRKLAKQRKGK